MTKGKRTKRKSNAWIQKNSELSSFVIRYCGVGSTSLTVEQQNHIAKLGKELDLLEE